MRASTKAAIRNAALPLGVLLSAEQWLVLILFASITMTVLAYFVPLAALAMGFFIVAMILSWRYPHLVMMAIFITAPFQNDISGGGKDSGGGGLVAFSIAELLFAATLPAFLINAFLQRRKMHMGPIAVPVLLYFAFCIASILTATSGYSVTSGLVSLAQMFLYMVLAVMAFTSFPKKPEDLLIACRGAVIVGIGLSVVMLAAKPETIGLNKNGIGSSIGASLLICAELWFASEKGRNKLYYGLSMGLLMVALLFSLSRGAWIGTVTGLFVILLLRRQFRVLIRSIIIVTLAVPVFWNLLPKQKRDYVTGFDVTRVNISSRLRSIRIATKCFERNPWFGAGLGLRKEVDATNLFWFTLGESGVFGLTTFILIHLVFYRMIWTTQRHVSRKDPMFSILVVGGALLIARGMHGMVDHYWSRGETMMTWSSVGMASGVYYAVRRRRAAAVPSLEAPDLSPIVGEEAMGGRR